MHYPNFPSFSELQKIFIDEDAAISYLIENGGIFRVYTCVCGFACSLNLERRCFRCYRNGCGKEVSMFKGSFFFKTSLKKNMILHLAHFWLCGGTSLSGEMYFGLSDKTIASYFNYFRELVADSLDIEDFKIGGQDIVVQIDESKFGRRKYHRGHRVDGVWIFGGVETTQERKVFLVLVPDRTEETLLAYIEKHIYPGSIIVSDMWRSYTNIKEKLSFRHYTVNHSIEFVDSSSGMNTNTIEGTWSGVKRKLPVRKRTEAAINAHLLEFVWRRKHFNDLWGGLLRSFAEISYDL
jgi:transposase-like protein